MSIQRYFNRSVVILRLKATSGFKKTMVSTGTVDAHIQRLDEAMPNVGGNVGADVATHRAWVGLDVTVRDGDEVRDPDGNVYSVVAVTDEGRDIAINEHKQLLLKIYNVPNVV